MKVLAPAAPRPPPFATMLPSCAARALLNAVAPKLAATTTMHAARHSHAAWLRVASVGQHPAMSPASLRSHRLVASAAAASAAQTAQTATEGRDKKFSSAATAGTAVKAGKQPMDYSALAAAVAELQARWVPAKVEEVSRCAPMHDYKRDTCVLSLRLRCTIGQLQSFSHFYATASLHVPACDQAVNHPRDIRD